MRQILFNSTLWNKGFTNLNRDVNHYKQKILHATSSVFTNTQSACCLSQETSKKVKEDFENPKNFKKHFKKALILTKFSRYEFEKKKHPHLSESSLIRNLEDRGSDYSSLLYHHNIHTTNKQLVVETLKENGFEVELVNRFNYSDDKIHKADVIFTTGGDGTFLMAASKVTCPNKPVIGINSDPSRSLGHLCLPFKYTENFPLLIKKLHDGEFNWSFRQRIRVTLMGEHALEAPIELHDQQLEYPEYRFIEGWQDLYHRHDSGGESRPCRVLPVRALNEVFVGESLSSRVSYYELSVDKSSKVKMKSSGMTVCTGTGSTSWYFNINKVTPQCVKHLFRLANQETGVDFPLKDIEAIEKVTQRFNNSLKFDPAKLTMAYSIRDPVIYGSEFKSSPRGFANNIEVKSRMFDACIVIDGGLSFVFNDGARAILEMREEDALRTVALEDSEVPDPNLPPHRYDLS